MKRNNHMNAMEILPPELVKEIQKYVQGQSLYIRELLSIKMESFKIPGDERTPSNLYIFGVPNTTTAG